LMIEGKKALLKGGAFLVQRNRMKPCRLAYAANEKKVK